MCGEEEMLKQVPRSVSADYRVREHDVPSENYCRCGIYTVHSLEALAKEFPRYPKIFLFRDPGEGPFTLLTGAMACEGRIVRGTNGARASHARIVCLTEYPKWATLRRLNLIKKVADANAVPYVPFEHLNTFLPEHGEFRAA